MAEKKSLLKKKAKPAAKTPVVLETPKDLVLDKFPKAECKEIKNRFAIFDLGEFPLHSGLADLESNAWKLAAHNL